MLPSKFLLTVHCELTQQLNMFTNVLTAKSKKAFFAQNGSS